MGHLKNTTNPSMGLNSKGMIRTLPNSEVLQVGDQDLEHSETCIYEKWVKEFIYSGHLEEVEDF